MSEPPSHREISLDRWPGGWTWFWLLYLAAFSSRMWSGGASRSVKSEFPASLPLSNSPALHRALSCSCNGLHSDKLLPGHTALFVPACRTNSPAGQGLQPTDEQGAGAPCPSHSLGSGGHPAQIQLSGRGFCQQIYWLSIYPLTCRPHAGDGSPGLQFRGVVRAQGPCWAYKGCEISPL